MKKSLDDLLTEREARLREREAFVKGAQWRFGQGLADGTVTSRTPLFDHEDYERAAGEHFPIRTTQPRLWVEERGDRLAWKYEDGKLWWCWEIRLQLSSPGWQMAGHTHVTPERITAWANLIANPTEEVEL